jgi:hypothetical protein
MEPLTLEDRLRGAIEAATVDDETISFVELVGTLELLKAELVAAAMEPDEDDAE